SLHVRGRARRRSALLSRRGASVESFHFFPGLSGEDASGRRQAPRTFCESPAVRPEAQSAAAALSSSGNVSPGPDTVRTPVDDAIAQVEALEARDSALPRLCDRLGS